MYFQMQISSMKQEKNEKINDFAGRIEKTYQI